MFESHIGVEDAAEHRAMRDGYRKVAAMTARHGDDAKIKHFC